MTLVGCCKVGFLVMHSRKQYSSFDDYLRVLHSMDNWLEIVKPHLLCGWLLTESFVSWIWKSSVYCYLYWQNGFQYLKLSLQQYLQTFCSWCLSISLFLNMNAVSPLLIQLASGTGKNQNVHELFRCLSSERHSDVSQAVPFCSVEDLMVFIL